MSRFQKYLSKEIGIEFKACLYMYCILFFDCCYQFLNGKFSITIAVLMEVILTAYLMGYLQVYVMGDFDEADSFGWSGLVKSVICSGLYCAVSFIGNWFDRKPAVTALFFVFLLFAYWCVFLIYKIKRNIDTKELNENLAAFKEKNREEKNE